MSEENKNTEQENQEEFMDNSSSSMKEPTVENAPEPEQSLNELNDNMEVHHHPHAAHGKKTWKAYFWEFLMLFLAVFCGFLAEYQLEHMIERDRETQYMSSMLDDLKQDTAEINNQIRFISEYFKPVLKKSVAVLYSENFSDSTIKEMYDTVPKAIRFFTLAIQDNAITQLKNSGNLRLIRKKGITDSLAKYWYSCNHLLNTLVPGYEATRFNSKELVYSLFNLHYFENDSTGGSLRKNISLKLVSEDKAQFLKLGNNISNLNSQLTGAILVRLKDMNRKATDLIALIEREYHLK